MGKVFGLIVIMLGGIIAFQALSPREANLAVEIAAAPHKSTLEATVDAVPTPQPATADRRRQEARLTTRKPPTLSTNEPQIVAAQQVRPETKPANTPNEASTAIVKATAPQHVAELAPRQESRPPRAPSPLTEDAADQTALTRTIQSHLHRVGCYSGPINGQWSDASMQAMKDFNARVNASLPVTRPDQVLLALVENYKDKACGLGCPPGQALNASGRCARLEAAAKPPQRPVRAVEATRSEGKRRAANQVATAPASKTKVAIVEPWRTTTTAKAPAEPGIRTAPKMPAPTIVATARKELNEAKEAKSRPTPMTPPMALGIKPPAAVPGPVPQATEPATTPATPPLPRPTPEFETTAATLPASTSVKSASRRPQETEQNSAQEEANVTNALPRRAAVVRAPSRLAPEVRYVRRAPTAPVIIYRAASTTSYSQYLRSGAIWRKNELNGR